MSSTTPTTYREIASAAPEQTTSTYTIADVATCDDTTLRMIATRRGLGGVARGCPTDTLRGLIQVDMKAGEMKAKREAVEVVDPDIDESADDEDDEIADTRTAYGDGEVEDDDDEKEEEEVEPAPTLTPAQKAKATLARRAALWARCEARPGWEPLAGLARDDYPREVVVGFSVGEACCPDLGDRIARRALHRRRRRDGAAGRDRGWA